MKALRPLEPAAAGPLKSADAVVVIPGIMGSRLVEVETNRTLWGLGIAVRIGLRWRDGEGLAALAVTPEERDGRTARVRPAGLLSTAEFAPILRGIEPYGRMVGRLRQVLVHPDALLEFAYDWRLSVAFNAERLAVALRDHLAAWAVHPGRPAGPAPQAVLVAHSMGGLVATAMCAQFPEQAAQVRATVTLGTPFQGAVKAVRLLNSGSGTALEHRNMRQLALTLPGVYDLLPASRCLTTDDDVVALDSRSAVAMNCDAQLFEQSRSIRDLLDPSLLPNHLAIVGVGQQTEQSMRIEGGVVQTYDYGYVRHADGELVRDEIGRPVRKDHSGDGTVFRYSATPSRDGGSGYSICLAQQHGALARSRSALDIVCGVVTDVAARTALGDVGSAEGAVGLRVPELAVTGERFSVIVDHVPEAAAVSCVVQDVFGNADPVLRPKLERGDFPDSLIASVVLTDPGLYRIAVSNGSDPVTQLVLVQG